MNTYPVQFYDLLSRALGGNDGRRLQGFLDNVVAKKYNQLNIPGFKFAYISLMQSSVVKPYLSLLISLHSIIFLRFN